mgnify:CR=1 FL=1
MSDEIKSGLEELNRLFDVTSARAKIGREIVDEALPVLNAAREEQQHALSLIDSLVDKVLDLAKLLVAVSVPALVALYSLREDQFKTDLFIKLSCVALFFGLVLFVAGMLYKLEYLPRYLNSSSVRLDIYNKWIKAAALHAKDADLKLDLKKLTKKP